MSYIAFVNLRYKPKKTDLICEFRVEPAKGVSMKEAAGAVAAESSVGTWTKVKTMKSRIKRLGAKVFSIRKKYIKVAYPEQLFEKGNIPQILSSIAGNVFGMKVLKNLRLNDIDFPDSIIKSFKGPSFGVKGVRRVVKVPKRPLVGTIIKPKLGLNETEHANVAYQAWIGGCDIVKDDENLSNQKFNQFKKRIIQTLKMRRKAEKETGEIKVYMPNVTAETNEMLKRAKFVKKNGGRYIMVDIITVGFSSVQTLRQANLGLVIHAHRAMHGAITHSKKHGISMLVIAKISRLIGVDQIHIGTVVGKMEGGLEVPSIREQIEEQVIRPDRKDHVLGERWHDIKPVFAVCSGGLHPGHVPKLIKLLGKDIIIQAGGGIHGHPDGTVAGAKAMRQAVDSFMKGKSISTYSKKHKELKKALGKWGVAR
jgi:ribulose-bisphosphate carboxylase large chain